MFENERLKSLLKIGFMLKVLARILDTIFSYFLDELHFPDQYWLKETSGNLLQHIYT